MRKKAEDLIRQLVKEEVLEDCKTPPECVNRILFKEKKDGTLRTLLDPRPFNKILKRPFHQMPKLHNVIEKEADRVHIG